MKPGIYNDLDINEYHNSEGISSTGISLLQDCPKRYHYEYLVKRATWTADDIKKDSAKYKLGRAVHNLLLEPEKFEQYFYVMKEKVNLTTKIGKELYAQAELEANGREILRVGDVKAAEYEKCKEMALAISQAAKWKEINSLGLPKIEHSIYWEGGIYKTLLKARPDFFNDHIIVDIKTTESIKKFKNSIYNFGYHRQAAMQIDALKSIDGIDRKFGFIVVETRAPHMVAFFELDVMGIEQGRSDYLQAAALYTECLIENKWPGYDENFQMISLPEWAYRRESDEF